MAEQSKLSNSGIDSSLYQSCEAVGDIIQFWGFKKLTGMVWCYLYLSQEPRPAQEIREALGISAGSVSMTLKELLHWGVVTRTSPPGERSQHFAAEGDLWKMVSKVLRERDMEQIERTLSTLRRTETEYRMAGPEEKELARFRAERLAELVSAGDIVSGLLKKLLTTGVMNVKPLWPLHLRSLVRRGAKKVREKKGTGS